jgi:hypothetical protein
MPKLIGLGLFFLCITFGYEITSNAFEYDSDKNTLHLSDNVELNSDRYLFHTDRAYLDVAQEIISINAAFDINFSGKTINGQGMIMRQKESTMEADQLTFLFEKYLVEGHQVKINESEVNMNHVRMSSCKSNESLLYLKSETLTMYSYFGLLVAFNSFFYIMDVPVFYLPAYVVGSKRYSAFSDNSLVPELGSNLIEGNYVKEKIPYYVDENNNGSLFLGYIENGGLKAGLSHFTHLFDRYRVNMSYYQLSSYWQGEFILKIPLINPTKRLKPNLLLSLFESAPEEEPMVINLIYNLTEKDVVNNQMVSFLPKVSVESTFSLGDSHQLSVEYHYANVVEKKSSSGLSIYSTLALSSQVTSGPLSFKNIILGENRIYDSPYNQKIIQDNLSFVADISPVEIGIMYEKMIYFNGQSPFLYDQYQMDGYDKIEFSSIIHVENYDVGYRVKRRVMEEYVYSEYYELIFRLGGCVDTTFYYETVENEFGFKVQI